MVTRRLSHFCTTAPGDLLQRGTIDGVITRGSVDALPQANLSLAPDEPLADSAPFAWAEAPLRCTRDPETGNACVSYHRVWQYLRLLGIISSTRTNTDFLIGRFRESARTGHHPAALVSGTADYSMLAHLRCAYAVEGAVLDVTVIDRCETALALNRWYAARYGFRLTTAHTNILDYQSDQPFDLVCTHNFLSRFDPEARRRLVARWRALLRPGGVVVTTQRVQPHQTADRNRIDEDEARELSRRAAEAARIYPARLEISPEELEAAVYEFAIVKETYSIRTTEELTEIFGAAGFDIELADEGGGAAEHARDRPIRKHGAGSFRMRIVARRQ